MTHNLYDVIIVGGGVMGCATAYYLTIGSPDLKVVVIEKDPTYTHASSTLSLANARIQFSLAANVRISQYTFSLLENFDSQMACDGYQPAVSYRREGNLFIVTEPMRPTAMDNLNMQKKLGCRVQWLSPALIAQHYPLYKIDDIAGATFGPQDGHFDAYAFLMGYKRNAQAQGVRFIKAEVQAISRDTTRVEGVQLRDGTRLVSQVVINCAGAWAAPLAATAGVDIPVQPVKRQVFAVDTAEKPLQPLPLTVLPSGLYFRSETGGLILVGQSMPDDPVGFDFTWRQERFLEKLWPGLAQFVPSFERLKLVRGWAGLYAVNTLDANAVIGQWPELKGFYLANGFSGHGLQQAPAVGRYLAELINKNTHRLDLSLFGPERILAQKPLSEGGIV